MEATAFAPKLFRRGMGPANVLAQEVLLLIAHYRVKLRCTTAIQRSNTTILQQYHRVLQGHRS